MRLARSSVVFFLAALLAACSSSGESPDAGSPDVGAGKCTDETIGKPCTGGVGECARQGVFVCDDATGAVTCDAVPGKPSPEICDGKDNDCNGTVDDQWPEVGRSCTVGVGECVQMGFIVCSADGKSTECSAKPLPPQDEICDGKDNNCDGKIDETFSDLGKPCTSGVGECARPGKFICSPDHQGTVCDAIAGDPQPEICDGKDNNCDGEIDETFTDLGKPCTVGKGECARTGKIVCSPDHQGTVCDAAPGDPQPEVCDGKDNNCNGFVDENAPDCAVVIAGNGRPPLLTGKGLTETWLAWPAGVAYIAARNELYASDLYAGVIFRLVWDDVDRVWMSSILAGSGYRGDTDGAADQAAFSGPAALAPDVDGAGLYVADSVNHSVKYVALATGETVRVAGTGSKGSADGPGATATFAAPQALAVGTDGAVYVADTGNHCVRKVVLDTVSGLYNVSTFAGKCGTAGSANAQSPADARFNAPHGVAVAADGSVFVADTGNMKIRLVESAGGVSDYAAIPQSSLRALAVDEFGYLFAVDGRGSLKQVSPTRTVTTITGGLGDPAGIAIGKGSSAYVAEQGSGDLRKVNLSNGSSALAAGTGTSPTGDGPSDAPLVYPSGLAVDESKDLVYFADTVAHRVKLLRNWQVSPVWGDGSAGTADTALDLPGRMALSGDDLVVADAGAHCLRRYRYDPTARTWTATVLAGACGVPGNAEGTAATARLNAPAAVATGPGGALLVADAGNHCVRKFDGTAVTTFSGRCGTAGLKNGAQAVALYRAPEGVACDPGSGFCFVADTGNHVLRQVAPDGTVSPFSGVNALPAGGGDGGYADGDAASSRFNEPAALSVASPGGALTVFVADRLNHVVRAVDIDGNTSTVLGKNHCGHSSGKKEDTELCLPTDVSVAPSGTLYVADAGNDRVIALYK